MIGIWYESIAPLGRDPEYYRIFRYLCFFFITYMLVISLIIIMLLYFVYNRIYMQLV